MNRIVSHSPGGAGLDPENAANVGRLAGCERPHDFQSVAMPGEDATRGRYRCRKCGGFINHRSYHHYREGLRDGLRSAERHYQEAVARASAGP